MEIKIELSTKILKGTTYFHLETSLPYGFLGEALWEWVDEGSVLELINGVNKTMRGDWGDYLPLDFGNDIVGVWVYPDYCDVLKKGEEERITVPTVKVLHLLNMWLHFLRLAS